MDDQSGAAETSPGLGSRLDRLNAEVAALTTSLAASQALPVDMLALPGRVDDLGAGLSEIRVGLASIDELSDRTDRLQELLLAIAQELAARPADPPSVAPAPSEGPTLEDLAQRIDSLAQGSPDGRVLDSRLAAIEAELSRQKHEEAGLRDAVAAERRATIEAVTSTLVASLSRLDGELGANLRSIETMLGGFGDALASRIAAAFPADPAAGRVALTQELAELGRRTTEGVTEAVTGAVTEAVTRAATELQRSSAEASAATSELTASSQQALTSFHVEADAAVAALVERVGARTDVSAVVRDAVADAVAAAMATVVATSLEGAVASALDEPVRQLEAAAARSDELVEAVTSTEARTASIAERIWTDTTRALEAFSDEAGEAVVSTVAGAQKAVDAAAEASRAGSEIAAAFRAELVGLRQAVRAAVAEPPGAAGTASVDTDAIVGAIAEAEGERLAAMEAATLELQRSIEGGNDAIRTALDGVLASMAGTLDAVAGAVDRQSGLVTAGMQDTMAGVHDAMGSLREVLSNLLADQLLALDHRQGLIEDGLRAMWARLDRVDTSIDEALMTPPVLPPDLTLDLQASIRDAVEVAMAGALANEETRLAAARNAIDVAIARIEASASGSGESADVVAAVAQLREQVAAGIDSLPDHVAAILASLPDGVANVVRERFSAELGATVLELTGKVEAALGRLPAELADTVALPADSVAASVAEQVRARLEDDLGPVLERLTVASAGLPAQLEVIPTQIADAVADMSDRIAATVTGRMGDDLGGRLGAEIADALVPRLERRAAENPDGGQDLANLVADAVTDRLGAGVGPLLDSLPDVLTAAVGELRTQVRSELAQSLEQVVAATASLPARLGPIPDLVAAAIADLPDRVAVTVSQRLLAELTPALGEHGARLDTATAGFADFAGRLAAAAEASGNLGAVPDQVTALLSSVPDDLAAAVTTAVEGAVTTAVEGAVTTAVTSAVTTAVEGAVTTAVEAAVPTAVSAAVEESVRTAIAGAVAERTDDAEAIAGRIAEAVTEHFSATLGPRIESLPDELTDVVRGLPEYTAALVAEAVEAATARAVASLPVPEPVAAPPSPAAAAAPVDLTAAIEALRADIDAGVTAAVTDAMTGAVTSAVATAVTDAVQSAIAAAPAPPPAPEAPAPPNVPDLVAGMVPAVAATLQEFGERVQGDLDAVGAQIEDLSGVLEQAVEVFTEMGTRRRENRSEALSLLRQVANEAAEGIRSDNRLRRGLPTGPVASEG